MCMNMNYILANAAGWEEEPVHEDAGAVVVWIVGQQPAERRL